MNKKPTKYADMFCKFQVSLNEYQQALRDLYREYDAGNDNLENFRQNADAAKVKVLQKYNDVLTALQTQEQTL